MFKRIVLCTALITFEVVLSLNAQPQPSPVQPSPVKRTILQRTDVPGTNASSRAHVCVDCSGGAISALREDRCNLCLQLETPLLGGRARISAGSSRGCITIGCFVANVAVDVLFLS
jgi:hypothetical protein